MKDDKRNRMLAQYNKLITIYSDLLAEVEELTEEEKILHNDILAAVDKNKIMKMKEYVKNIKE